MATDEVLNYRATSELKEVIFSNGGDKYEISLNPNLYKLESNPYFDKVSDIFNKFGKTTSSPYYTIQYNMKYNGRQFIDDQYNSVKCEHVLYVSPNNNELIKTARVNGTQNFPQSTYSFSPTWAFVNDNFLFYYLEYIYYNRSTTPSIFPYCSLGDTLTLNLQIEITGQIFMKKYCDQNYMDNICTIFCSDEKNVNLCLDANINYCFDKPLNPQFSKFFVTDACKIYAKQYMATNVSHPQYDKIFRNICKTLNVDASNYKNYTQGVDPQFDLEIKNMCACNLDDSIYNNFLDSFAAEIPTIKAANFGSKKCIFPECSTSEYKPTEILGYNTCPSIDCINVTQIDNNGRIIGGLTITQTSDCPNLQDTRRPCSQDSECGLGKKCFGGLCVDNNVCRVKSNCDVDSKCYNNICVRDDFCTRDSDCGDGLKCSKNICVKEVNVSDVRKTLIIFIVSGAILLLFLLFIILSYFIKRSKRSK
jgi:hypothetical protein